MRHRLIIWGGGILAVILIAIFVVAYLIDEPLRWKVEREMNARLKGYTVRIEKLDFHPIRLSLDLKKFWVYQTPQPDPPIAYIPNACKRSLESTSFVQEAKDPTPMKDEGW